MEHEPAPGGTARQGYAREESRASQYDRNYNELLQELRVAETGVQLLFAFLLAIAFQNRFQQVTAVEKTAYLIALVSAAVSALLLIAPVPTHRLLFRRRMKDELVIWASRLAMTGLSFLLLSMVAAIYLIIDVVLNPVAAAIIAGVLGAAAGWLWYAYPLAARRDSEPADLEPDDEPPLAAARDGL